MFYAIQGTLYVVVEGDEMEESLGLESEDFWVWMKLGEEQFDGLYAILTYREEQYRIGEEYYSSTIMEEVYALCRVLSCRGDEFSLWLHELCTRLNSMSRDTLAERRVLQIWKLCSDLQCITQKTIWLSFEAPAANNAFY